MPRATHHADRHAVSAGVGVRTTTPRSPCGERCRRSDRRWATRDRGWARPFCRRRVLSEPEFIGDKKSDRDVKVVRLGSLRYGEKAPALSAEPLKKANCPEGWYALLAGGYVCGKYATTDLEHPKLRMALPPDYEGPLPYAYGVNLFNGTPLYRQLPSRAQRRKLEPWLFRTRKAKVVVEPQTGLRTWYFQRKTRTPPRARRASSILRRRGRGRWPCDRKRSAVVGERIARRRTAPDHAGRPARDRANRTADGEGILSFPSTSSSTRWAGSGGER